MNRRQNRAETGASAVEYGLLVAAIAAIIIVVVFAVGQFTQGSYQDTCNSLAAGEFSGSNTCP